MTASLAKAAARTATTRSMLTEDAPCLAFGHAIDGGGQRGRRVDDAAADLAIGTVAGDYLVKALTDRHGLASGPAVMSQ